MLLPPAPPFNCGMKDMPDPIMLGFCIDPPRRLLPPRNSDGLLPEPMSPESKADSEPNVPGEKRDWFMSVLKGIMLLNCDMEDISEPIRLEPSNDVPSRLSPPMSEDELLKVDDEPNVPGKKDSFVPMEGTKLFNSNKSLEFIHHPLQKKEIDDLSLALLLLVVFPSERSGLCPESMLALRESDDAVRLHPSWASPKP